MDTPLGILEIIGTNEAVSSILFVEREEGVYMRGDDTPDVLIDCHDQLVEYFNGSRRTFSFPVRVKGTDFQKRVWKGLLDLAYGETGSYKELALSIGNEKAIRAVGSANGKNKLSIVIPCHRIIGSNGTMTGYAGGVWRKEWLLRHEGKHENS
ncbi:methylated-DNA--protein-cysteine methyltransferase [Rossellomorea marisflavi]|nr:methylated-DNA--protein-cysteine methyltransferase [Rossellomorea marisflavi]